MNDVECRPGSERDAPVAFLDRQRTALNRKGLARYARAVEGSRRIAAARELDDACARPDVIDCNLRWVLLHLIEETDRHAGHADIIRESLDGSRGA